MKSKKKHIIWEFENESISGYLMGTIHIKDSRILEDWQLIEECVLSCDVCISETDIDDLASASGINKIFNENADLETDLGQKKYAKLDKLFKKSFGQSIEPFRHMNPFYLVNYITTLYLKDDIPYNQDELIWRLAKENNIKQQGLESVEEQMQIFDKMDAKVGLDLLLKLAKNWSKIKKNTKKLLELYLNADVNKLFQYSKKQAGGLRKLLIYNRNIIMADRIAQLEEGNKYFIAIGAGHLGGKKGVLRLMKKSGFQLKRLVAREEAVH